MMATPPDEKISKCGYDIELRTCPENANARLLAATSTAVETVVRPSRGTSAGTTKASGV